jgi:hypothetical protein
MLKKNSISVSEEDHVPSFDSLDGAEKPSPSPAVAFPNFSLFVVVTEASLYCDKPATRGHRRIHILRELFSGWCKLLASCRFLPNSQSAHKAP